MDLDRRVPFCHDCGKGAYPTEGAAAAEIRRQRGRGGRAGRPPTHHYPCPSGNGHHLASRNGRRRRGR